MQAMTTLQQSPGSEQHGFATARLSAAGSLDCSLGAGAEVKD
ncbi:MAG: hypothetical protein WBV94_21390 [Blastocatellia bacterium]